MYPTNYGPKVRRITRHENGERVLVVQRQNTNDGPWFDVATFGELSNDYAHADADRRAWMLAKQVEIEEATKRLALGDPT